MIEKDARFGNVGIYLAGYYTAPDAEAYSIEDCAREILGALSQTRRHWGPSSSARTSSPPWTTR
jgi:hypothetical protein